MFKIPPVALNTNPPNALNDKPVNVAQPFTAVTVRVPFKGGVPDAKAMVMGELKVLSTVPLELVAQTSKLKFCPGMRQPVGIPEKVNWVATMAAQAGPTPNTWPGFTVPFEWGEGSCHVKLV